MIFLRQSIRSDYCAIYATAMAIAAAGYVIDKKIAMKSFGAKPGKWFGACHSQMLDVLGKHVDQFGGKWRHIAGGNVNDVVKLLAESVLTSGATIVTAYCRHRKLDLLCGHVFVLTGLDAQGIHVLDSLGKKPDGSSKYNAKILFHQNERVVLLPVLGAVWDIDLSHEVSFIGVPAAT